jgi:hypothetical protein
LTIPFMASLPRTYNPGKGRPTEYPAFLSPDEMEMLLALTDGRAEMTPHGLPSFADDSASSKGVSRGGNGAVGSGSTRTANGSVSKVSPSGGGSQSSGGSNSGSRPSGTSTNWMSGNTPTTRSSIPRVPGGYGAQAYDRLGRAYSNPPVYTPPSNGPKQHTDRVPIGGPFSPGNSAQRPDRPGYGRPEPAAAASDTDYPPADRSGDDFATRSGFGRIASRGITQPRSSVVRSGQEFDRDTRRMDEKNNSSFGGMFGDTLFRIMRRSKHNV